MSEPFIAEIIMFGGNFAPRSWAYCDGNLLPIASNTALFSLVGTTYGGDGRTTMGLPGLRGRVPLGAGRGPGLPEVRLGVKGGRETNTLTAQTMPSHTHSVSGAMHVLAGAGNQQTATGNFLASDNNPSDPGNSDKKFSADSGTTEVALNAGSVRDYAVNNNTSTNAPVPNIQPYLAINYIICLQGVYPSRS